MSIKILIDHEEPKVGGWKVMCKRRGHWDIALRGTMDECQDYARALADDLRMYAIEGR